MVLYEYVNPNPHEVTLSGPNKEIVKVPKFSKVVLSEWYIGRYTPKFIRVVRKIGDNLKTIPQPAQKGKLKKVHTRNKRPKVQKIPRPKIIQKRSVRSIRQKDVLQRRKPVVGKPISGSPQSHYIEASKDVIVPFSNGIGVGILSYNRLYCIKRLISSIRQYTDMSRTTIFVSDESTDKEVQLWLKDQNDICVLQNTARLGIAGQSNRLLNCLERFEKIILLNDDVEVLAHGWDRYYFDIMSRTDYHHFCYRQHNVYGAKNTDGKLNKINGVNIRTISEKPHGAVLALTNTAFKKVGYFDESFGPYGIEHVDYSNRIGLSGLQPRGFHDVVGSDKYFRIFPEKSSSEKSNLNNAKQKYNTIKNDVSRIYVSASSKCNVPTISCVIPCRITESRSVDSIKYVVENIRAQLFPKVEIIVAEQDDVQRIGNIHYTKTLFVKSPKEKQPFTKSLAFNAGVHKASSNKIVLHDADITVPNFYFSTMASMLDQYDGVHIGQRVLYFTKDATDKIYQSFKLDSNCQCDRVVGYFEGGSLGCTKETYIRIGGFNEVYIGYGVEDCDFFYRLKQASKQFLNDRSIDFFHLWHGRSPEWEECHKKNRRIFANLYRRQALGEIINNLNRQFIDKYK